MPHELELLPAIVAKLLEGTTLTPKERADVLIVTRGFITRAPAPADGHGREAVRARRKRTYRKLGVSGRLELMAQLLGVALGMISAGERLGEAPDHVLGSERVTDNAAAPSLTRNAAIAV